MRKSAGRTGRGLRVLPVGALLVLLAACADQQWQSVLNPAGPQATRLRLLWWLVFGISALVFALVLAALGYASRRGHRRWREAAPSDAEAAEAVTVRRMTRGVTLATAATVLILFAFLVYDFPTARALVTRPPEPLRTIGVIGHQWWWEVHYRDTLASNQVTTANEIHVPVGEPVLLKLSAADVIHSFWVPNLHGKKDLIPGQQTEMWFRADSAGIYRGQCAEFCGFQHAKMAMFIVAEPSPQFAAWLARQRRPGSPPRDSLQARGQQVFLGGTCATCHTITGTMAAATVGPDLTHLASRMTIGAGTLRNTRGNLAGWVVDPQAIKPGVRMPASRLSPADLQALLKYLEGLE